MDNLGSNKETLRVLWKVMAQIQRDWRLSDEELGQALGGLSADFVALQKAGSTGTIPDDAVLRASHLMNIYRALHSLLTDKTIANTWVDRPNKAELFGGRPARDLIVSGDVKSLAGIQAYLFSV